MKHLCSDPQQRMLGVSLLFSGEPETLESFPIPSLGSAALRRAEPLRSLLYAPRAIGPSALVDFHRFSTCTHERERTL